MSLVPPFLRGSYPFAFRSKDRRQESPNLTGLLPSRKREADSEPMPEPTAAVQPDAKTVLEMLNHAAEALDYLQTRCRELEADAEDAAARAQTRVVDAQRAAAVWQQRALVSESQVEELETRLADADQIAMELRARLVCLYGKLAASVDTVRFQALARALAEADESGINSRQEHPARVAAA